MEPANQLFMLLKVSRLKFVWYSGTYRWALYRLGFFPECYGPFPSFSLAEAQMSALDFLKDYVATTKKNQLVGGSQL